MPSVTKIGLFPNCLPPSNPFTISENTYLGSSFKSETIAGGVGFYWRIKKFRFNIAGTVRVVFLDEQELNDTYSGYVELERATVVLEGEEEILSTENTTEKNLVCGNVGWKINNGGDYNLDGTGIVPYWIDRDQSRVHFGFPLFIESSEGSNTRTYLSVYLTNNNDNGSIPPVFRVGEIRGDVEASEFTLDFGNGITLKTLKWTFPKVVEYDEGTYYFNYDIFNMEVLEWWGYDPEDGGGPIYNTSTGERIRFDV